LSLLADARIRAEGAPGLTAKPSDLLRQQERERSSEGPWQCYLSWHLCLRSHFYEVTSATLGSLLLKQPPKSKPVIPLLSCRRPRVACSPPMILPGTTLGCQRGFPLDDRDPLRGGVTALLRRLRSGNGDGPRGRWRWPKRARGGRPAGSEPVLEVRASPEMRPGSHDWAATPQASLSHM
jgi:hypothetical protein